MVKMKCLTTVGVCFVFMIFLASASSAIPDSEIYNFKSSITGVFYFDEYNPKYDGIHGITRELELLSFYNESQYYYIVIRKSSVDQPPYDDFFVTFICDAEPVTSFHTTDYTSWVESGQISFKKQYGYQDDFDYGTGSIRGRYSYCQIREASNLTVSGNTGYTTFNVDLVPVTISSVQSVESYCEEEYLRDTITAQLSAMGTIVETNVGFVSTIFTVFQTLVIVFIVIGIPILIFLFIRWAVWKITGIRILERKEY